VVFALVATGIGLIYYFAPDVDQDWVWLTPGSVVATALWFAGSLGFRFYVVNFTDYNATYGAIGGVMVLLLWLYMTGLVIIVGAEMNAEIEQASPHGKEAGEKVPGQRKRIGARAAREFEARRRQRPPNRCRCGRRSRGPVGWRRGAGADGPRGDRARHRCAGTVRTEDRVKIRAGETRARASGQRASLAPGAGRGAPRGRQ
jgi:hypothetical protein